MLSAVTYNVFLGKTFDKLFDWLFLQNELQDIYCFQEFPQDKLSAINKYFSKKNYASTFADGFKWREKTYGELTLFNTNKLKLVDKRILSLGGKGELDFVFIRDGFKIDSRLARIAINKTSLVTTFQYKNKNFSLANAHLCSDIYNHRKLKQLKIVIDAIQKYDSTIILGDFNYPFGKGLAKLMEEEGFESAFKPMHTFRFAPGIFWQNDYIFQKHCPIQNVEAKKINHSDHYPLFFKILLD